MGKKIQRINKYLIISCVVLIVQSCTNEDYVNDWEKDKLHGEVKSYSEFTFKAEDRFGKVEKGKRESKHNGEFHKHYKYDKTGNKIEENYYTLNGKLKSKITLKYNKKGSISQSKSYKSDGSIESKEDYKYDENANKIETLYSKPGVGIISKWMYFYNDDGNVIKRSHYRLGILESKTTYIYSNIGYSSYLLKYNTEGKIIERYDVVYDKDGKIIEVNSSTTDWGGSYKNIFSYNEIGNLTLEVVNYYSDGQPNYAFSYKYDDKNNVVKKITKNTNTNKEFIETYSYKYDKQGNWIERIEFEGEIPKFILEREFNYYE